MIRNAIDPNILHHPDGSKYLVAKGDRMLMIELQSPWKAIGKAIELPLLKCPLPQKEQWYEAPATWVRGDFIWLMYSRCNTGPDYEMMLAYCRVGDDVMNASSWRHFSNEPVIKGNGGDDTGPGHNGWFKSPDSTQDWIVYHGTAIGEKGRSSRAMQVVFNETGWPVFHTTPPLGLPLAEPGLRL